MRYEADKDDHDEYFYFTGRSRLDTAMHTLEGLVNGVISDGKVSDSEAAKLMLWLGQHAEFADRHPFNEVIPAVQQMASDGWIDESDRADLLWLCNKFTTEENYYDAVTSKAARFPRRHSG
jgi:hypothetical protein